MAFKVVIDPILKMWTVNTDYAIPLQHWWLIVWYGMTYFKMQKKDTEQERRKYMSFMGKFKWDSRFSILLLHLNIVNHFITTDFIHLRCSQIICTHRYTHRLLWSASANNSAQIIITDENYQTTAWLSMILHNHIFKCTLYYVMYPDPVSKA